MIREFDRNFMPLSLIACGTRLPITFRNILKDERDLIGGREGVGELSPPEPVAPTSLTRS
jgi:hypothetical protein